MIWGAGLSTSWTIVLAIGAVIGVFCMLVGILWLIVKYLEYTEDD